MFSNVSKTEIIIVATFKMLSINSLNLVQSKILWLSEESLTHGKILDLKFEAFSDEKPSEVHMIKKLT